MATTLLSVATFGSAAADGPVVIRQADVKSDQAPAAFAPQSQPGNFDRLERTAAGNPLWAIPVEALAATQERPLFSPRRRPPALPVTAVPSPPPQAPQPRIETEKPSLVLIGTVVNENKAIGIFLDQSTHRTVSLHTGQGQDGWLLGRVHKRDVVLQKDNAIFLLAISAEAIAPVAVAAQESEPRRERRQR